MKILLQIILTAYTILYLFAGLNNRKCDNQIFYIVAASILVILTLVTTTVL